MSDGFRESAHLLVQRGGGLGVEIVRTTIRFDDPGIAEPIVVGHLFTGDAWLGDPNPANHNALFSYANIVTHWDDPSSTDVEFFAPPGDGTSICGVNLSQAPLFYNDAETLVQPQTAQNNGVLLALAPMDIVAVISTNGVPGSGVATQGLVETVLFILRAA